MAVPQRKLAPLNNENTSSVSDKARITKLVQVCPSCCLPIYSDLPVSLTNATFVNVFPRRPRVKFPSIPISTWNFTSCPYLCGNISAVLQCVCFFFRRFRSPIVPFRRRLGLKLLVPSPLPRDLDPKTNTSIRYSQDFRRGTFLGRSQARRFLNSTSIACS